MTQLAEGGPLSGQRRSTKRFKLETKDLPMGVSHGGALGGEGGFSFFFFSFLPHFLSLRLDGLVRDCGFAVRLRVGSGSEGGCCSGGGMKGDFGVESLVCGI